MIKFRHLSIILFTLISAYASAQVGLHRQDFAIGVSGGYTLNKVSFQPSIKQMFKGNTQFGFASRYICEKYYNSICGVQIELNYQNLGWKEDLTELGVYGIKNNRFTRNLHSVELPLLMQMGWGKERKGLKFLFEAGPYLQYFFASSDEKYGEPWDMSYRPNNVDYQYDNNIDNKIAYGIQAGIGVELSTAIGHFIVDGRYCYGLGDMYDNTKKGFFGRSNNGTISAKVIYLFDIVRTRL